MFSVLSYVKHCMNSRSLLPDSTTTCFLVNIFQNFFISCLYFYSVSLCKVLFLCCILLLFPVIHSSLLV